MNENSIIKYTWKAADIHENNFSKIEIKMENITKWEIGKTLK